MNVDKSEERKRELIAELAKLTEVVESTTRKRNTFLDKHMHVFSKFEVGDILYNCRDGGTATLLYHYRTVSHQLDFEQVKYFIRYPSGRTCAVTNSQFPPKIPFVKLSDYENKTDAYYEKIASLGLKRKMRRVGM